MPLAPVTLPDSDAVVDRFLRPFQRFMATESAGGIVLLAATVLALAWANSPWQASYQALWQTYASMGFGEWAFRLSLHHLINDGLMAIFFFMVGLEIKREMLVGELASVKAAALPIAAAAGGMLIPALIYATLNAGGEGAAGWGIPMATDIAFALGILALMGRRAPLGLKVFLAALAIVDDLGAVLVIALFYTAELNMRALGLAAVLLGMLVALNRTGVRHPALYASLGVLLWSTFLASGVHATVAGVLLAMTVPARTRIDTEEFLVRCRESVDEFDRAGVEGRNVLTNEEQQRAIHALVRDCDLAQAPLLRLEHLLQPWVAFAIVPLFALANAGVALGSDAAATLTEPVALGIVLGLALGKPIGITLFSWLAVRARVAELPAGTNWLSIHAVSWLGGIGFTMSLFVGTLAFGEGARLLDAAKIGILLGSAVAALVGWMLLGGYHLRPLGRPTPLPGASYAPSRPTTGEL